MLKIWCTRDRLLTRMARASFSKQMVHTIKTRSRLINTDVWRCCEFWALARRASRCDIGSDLEARAATPSQSPKGAQPRGVGYFGRLQRRGKRIRESGRWRGKAGMDGSRSRSIHPSGLPSAIRLATFPCRSALLPRRLRFSQNSSSRHISVFMRRLLDLVLQEH